MEFVLKKEEDLKLLVKELIKIISSNKNKEEATTVALSGLLGSGKTTFVKYLAKELKIENHITSPTFLLIKEYRVPKNKLEFKNLFHIDAYRLESPKELESLGFNKIIKNPENIVVIEWAEKVKSLIPNNSTWINLSYGEKDNERNAEITFPSSRNHHF